MNNFCLLLFCLTLKVISSIGIDYKIENFNKNSGLYFQDMGDASVFTKSYRIILYLDLNKILKFDTGIYFPCVDYFNENHLSQCSNYNSILKEVPLKQNIILQNLGLNTDVFNLEEHPVIISRDFSYEDRILYSQIPYYHVRGEPDFITSNYNIHGIMYESSFGSAFPDKLNDNFSYFSPKNFIDELNDLFNQWQAEMKTLERAIHLAKRGKIEPSIFLPTILINALKYAKYNFTDADVPLELELLNYNDIVSISRSKISIQNGKLIFDLAVPMIEKDSYRLYRLVPWPMKLANQDAYFFVEPTEDFIAVKAHHHSYIPFKEEEIRNCKGLQEKKFCSFPSAMIDLDLTNTCESALISNHRGDFLSVCTVKLIKLRETVWHRLDNENLWLFTTSDDSINVTCCQEPVVKVALNNSGWIKLNSSCIAVSNLVTLKPFQKRVETRFVPKSNLFRVNVSKAVDVFLKTLTVQLDQIELDDFERKAYLDLEELKLIGTALNTIKKKNDLHCNHILLWISVVIFSLLSFGYILYQSFLKDKIWRKGNLRLNQKFSWRRFLSQEESIIGESNPPSL